MILLKYNFVQHNKLSRIKFELHNRYQIHQQTIGVFASLHKYHEKFVQFLLIFSFLFCFYILSRIIELYILEKIALFGIEILIIMNHFEYYKMQYDDS